MVESANDPLGEVLQYVADEADPVFGASGYLVIGALARDVILGRAADGWRLRSTSDVDLSIGVRDAGEFWTALDRLGEPRGIAIRRGLGRLPVDILPFGGVGTAGIFEHDGKQFDIRGLEDAFKASAACPLPGGRFVRVPTLASMLGLKVIAWGVRHQNTAKDARDLGALLDVTRDDP